MHSESDLDDSGFLKKNSKLKCLNIYSAFGRIAPPSGKMTEKVITHHSSSRRQQLLFFCRKHAIKKPTCSTNQKRVPCDYLTHVCPRCWIQLEELSWILIINILAMWSAIAQHILFSYTKGWFLTRMYFKSVPPMLLFCPIHAGCSGC